MMLLSVVVCISAFAGVIALLRRRQVSPGLPVAFDEEQAFRRNIGKALWFPG